MSQANTPADRLSEAPPYPMAGSPAEIHEIFAQAFRAKDIHTLMSLYEPEATLIPEPGQVAKGHAAIREALQGLLAMASSFTVRLEKVVVSDDIGLLISNWTLIGRDPAGNMLNLYGQTADVARRQPGGAWLLVIDNPYGSE